MPTGAFAGFAMLDREHGALLDKVRNHLVSTGSEGLLAELDGLRRMTFFGRTIMRQSERDQLYELLTRIYSSRKAEIDMQSKDYLALEAEIEHSATRVSAAMGEARALARDLRKLDGKLDAALRRSKAALTGQGS